MLALLLALVPLSGCAEDPAGPEEGLLTIRGSIVNRSGQAVPPGARVVVAWGVSAGSPDYTYIYGEGSVQAGAFRLTFDEPPPAEALNFGKLGVGVVLLTNDPAIRSGMRLEESGVDLSRIAGAAGNYAVIYRGEGSGGLLDWADAFPEGYGVGEGVRRPGGFDAFRPVPPSSVVLIVDDLEDIDFVNWT